MKKNFFIALALLLSCTHIETFAEEKNIFTSARASQAEYFEGCEKYAPSEEEIFIYPTLIEWSGDFSEEGDFHILFAENMDQPLQEIGIVSKTESFKFIHENKSAEAGKKYFYRINFVSPKGKIISDSTMLVGWGALSPTLYFIFYNQEIIYSHSKLTLMHKPNIFDKMGKEQIKGDLSGTLGYQTKVQGFSGVVPMPYKNYSDNDLFLLNGVMTTKANIYGNGKMLGKITVSGMYPGEVSYENVQIRNQKAGGGFYLVTPRGTSSSQIEYKYNFYGESK